MDTEIRKLENELDTWHERAEAEHPRSTITPRPAPITPAKDAVPLFWQVFGGTIVSVIVLFFITAYNQINSTESDMRRDVSQLQTDSIRKEEFNSRLITLWNSIKELQTNTTSRAGAEENSVSLHHGFETRIKANEEQARTMQRQLEQLNQRVQTLAERVAALEAAVGVRTPSVAPTNRTPN